MSLPSVISSTACNTYLEAFIYQDPTSLPFHEFLEDTITPAGLRPMVAKVTAPRNVHASEGLPVAIF